MVPGEKFCCLVEADMLPMTHLDVDIATATVARLSELAVHVDMHRMEPGQARDAHTQEVALQVEVLHTNRHGLTRLHEQRDLAEVVLLWPCIVFAM
jgi:hypothetical protein